jgi:hypothetical protein
MAVCGIEVAFLYTAVLVAERGDVEVRVLQAVKAILV